jgi:hypothetical protein
MIASLRKIDNSQLVAIPTAITVSKIVQAKTDEAKRNLVRAACFAQEEITTRSEWRKAEAIKNPFTFTIEEVLWKGYANPRAVDAWFDGITQTDSKEISQ